MSWLDDILAKLQNNLPTVPNIVGDQRAAMEPAVSGYLGADRATAPGRAAPISKDDVLATGIDPSVADDAMVPIKFADLTRKSLEPVYAPKDHSLLEKLGMALNTAAPAVAAAQGNNGYANAALGHTLADQWLGQNADLEKASRGMNEQVAMKGLDGASSVAQDYTKSRIALRQKAMQTALAVAADGDFKPEAIKEASQGLRAQGFGKEADDFEKRVASKAAAATPPVVGAPALTAPTEPVTASPLPPVATGPAPAPPGVADPALAPAVAPPGPNAPPPVLQADVGRATPAPPGLGPTPPGIPPILQAGIGREPPPNSPAPPVGAPSDAVPPPPATVAPPAAPAAVAPPVAKADATPTADAPKADPGVPVSGGPPQPTHVAQLFAKARKADIYGSKELADKYKAEAQEEAKRWSFGIIKTLPNGFQQRGWVDKFNPGAIIPYKADEEAGAESQLSGDELYQHIKKTDPNTAERALAIAEYRAPPIVGGRAGIGGGNVQGIAERIAAGRGDVYDAKNYNLVATARKEFSQVGQTGKALTSASTVIHHIGDAWDLIGNIPGSRYPTMNALKQAWANQWGDEKAQTAMSRLKQAYEHISTELDTALKSGKADVAGIKSIKDNLRMDAPPASQRGALMQSMLMLGDRVGEAKSTYVRDTHSKNADAWSPISPKAQNDFDRVSAEAKKVDPSFNPSWGKPDTPWPLAHAAYLQDHDTAENRKQFDEKYGEGASRNALGEAKW